ncbi:MAG: hypothetical protein K9M15_02310 [Candidatus Marinimicrobia bacterium]|nr:hypothetical protein [Candidatus Neomarinimicrobiota bacterium]
MNIFIKKELWNKYQKIVFALLFLVMVGLGASYICFMNVAVFKTAERDKNLSKLSETKTRFQELEIEYINKLEELSLVFAKSRGFVEAEPDNYIYKQKTVAQNSAYAEDFR